VSGRSQGSLYSLEAYKWQARTEGMKSLQDPAADFFNCSLLQLSMYLTLMFLSDRFLEGAMAYYLQNGVLDRLFTTLEKET
jgi:hypothetical protein